MTALILGTMLAVGALAFVLWPLFREPVPRVVKVAAPRHEPTAREQAVIALREIEFDRATGKLSESDYATLKATYSQQAVQAMREEESARRQAATAGATTGDVAAPLSDEAVEAAIRSVRQRQLTCPDCGPRPEMDAIYCSSCGRYLAGNCAACGAEISGAGARFCAACGAGVGEPRKALPALGSRISAGAA